MSITIIDNATYKTDYENKTGSLMFPNEFHNVRCYTDIKQVRKAVIQYIKDEDLNQDLIKGRRILNVIVKTNPTDEDVYINNRITYPYGVCVGRDTLGAVVDNRFGIYLSHNPIGDVIVVVSNKK